MAGRSVLVVDDSSLARESTAKLLTPHVAVVTAPSPDEALEVLARQPIDVVISDYQMPGMNGIELLGKVRELYPRALRILLTGVADLELAVQALNSGHVTKFFSKSVEREELRDELVQLCRYADVIADTPPKPRKTVLIADPSRIVASMIEQVLWDKYRIVSVSDGLSALQRLDTDRIDLVVTASRLRSLRGTELVRLVRRSRHAHIPVILHTAGESAPLCGDGAPDVVVRKSEDLSLLFKAINGFLQTDE